RPSNTRGETGAWVFLVLATASRVFYFFFFQAEDGIRDLIVTGVQTCALPIYRVIREHGLDLQLRLPHRGFHRAIGACAEVRVSPDGRLLSQADWDAHKREWLPTEADQVYVQNLMKPVTEPGKFANWIAPPARGINGQPVDFEYVRLV